MGIVTPTNKEVIKFSGLHLYHSGISNCSMRVRMTLEEKSLPWVSHHLDITKKEHITPEYFGINPNGVVPTLVHDGIVIIESDDIIDYLDKTFPEPPLRDRSVDGGQQMYHWMKKAVEIHVKAVKTHIYEKKVRGKMAQRSAEAEKYRNLQKNEELLEFHQKSTQGEFLHKELADAERILHECFAEINEVLGDREWIAGERFTLADITWLPLHFTLEVMADFPFHLYPNVEAWAARIATRRSFQKAVLDWWPDSSGYAS